ncbi:hypothetical protein NP493_71g04010 [Ridgeia piscesae]|uniref:Uncharacterized protein n=1 Tax=Ridgeia piscesae TaxID=27915 RepID=A0AAD9P9K4_RIDPI|nr:hypothetical protein NP493_71g04010 [Ridgeia piscesae]
MAGDLNLTLTCAAGHHLGALSAFAGISRTNICSYEPWDCVTQGGPIGLCDQRSMCLADRITARAGGTRLWGSWTDHLPAASVTVTLPERTDRLVTNGTDHPSPTHMSTSIPVLLVGGAMLALVLVVAVIAVLVHKLKNRSYPNSGLYGASHIEAYNPRTVRNVHRLPHRGRHQSHVTTVYDGQSSSYSGPR